MQKTDSPHIQRLDDDCQSLLREYNKLKEEIQFSSLFLSRYRQLVEIGSIITSSLNKREVLQRIIQQIRVLLECGKSSILLVDPEKNRLVFSVVSDREEESILTGIELEPGEGIAGSVWQSGEPVLITDAALDDRFSDRVDTVTDHSTHTLIAVPLISGGKTIGVMEAVNKSEGRFFNQDDLNFFQQMAGMAAVAIENSILYEHATRDTLTGLYVRRFMEESLSRELERSIRYRRSLSLLMLDLDHFKSINDRWGHDSGDHALRLVARVILQSCRQSDIACRYGGEEFVVILPETEGDSAMVFAERLRRRVEESDFRIGSSSVPITVSGGIATIRNDDGKETTAGQILSRADRALYRSKSAGRNRITLID